MPPKKKKKKKRQSKEGPIVEEVVGKASLKGWDLSGGFNSSKSRSERWAGRAVERADRVTHICLPIPTIFLLCSPCA
jgi:hypothetical protein